MTRQPGLVRRIPVSTQARMRTRYRPGLAPPLPLSTGASGWRRKSRPHLRPARRSPVVYATRLCRLWAAAGYPYPIFPSRSPYPSTGPVAFTLNQYTIRPHAWCHAALAVLTAAVNDDREQSEPQRPWHPEHYRLIRVRCRKPRHRLWGGCSGQSYLPPHYHEWPVSKMVRKSDRLSELRGDELRWAAGNDLLVA